MIRRAAIAPLFAAATACSDITPPRRSDVYSFDIAGDVFHWPAARLPVRYYTQPEGDLPQLTRHGLARWAAQFLYGEFRGTAVNDSTEADVVVAFEAGPPPPGVPDTASRARACEGETSVAVDSTNALERPLRVTVRWFQTAGFTPGEIAACLDRVVTHELGHTLGLFNPAHAGTDSSDLMYQFPEVYGPGPRDRATAEVLYHTPPTIAPPVR